MRVNIYYKIFQIMNCYDNIIYDPLIDNSFNTYEKYNSNDTFFTFIAENIKICPDIFDSKNSAVPETTSVPKTKSVPKTTTVPETTTEPETTTVPETTTEPKITDNNTIIVNNYIKKCFRIIVLKCHPDKNKIDTDSNITFIKCREYYEEKLLIGLLYICHIYNITPPSMKINMELETEDISNIIMKRILKEIRVIQSKLL